MQSQMGQDPDRYQLISLLGRGGTGAVYKAHDSVLQRDVAIKVLNPNFIHQPGFQEQFLQEARAAAGLNHPNIVRVHDFNPAQLYMVMEFIPGTNLHHLLHALQARDQLIPLPEAVRLVLQIALALDYAHQQGILHRDVKPDNVMLKPEESQGLPYRPILTDLGLSHLAPDGLPEGLSLDAPAYLSPEELLRQGVDARSDLYSLGVLLYELATGQRPYPAQSLDEAVRAHAQGAPPPPPRSLRPDLPPGLEGAILKALEPDPNRRFQSGAAFARALEAVLPEVQRTAPPVVMNHGRAHPGDTVSLVVPYQESLTRPHLAGLLEEPVSEEMTPSTLGMLIEQNAAQASGPIPIEAALDDSQFTVEPGQPLPIRISLLNQGTALEFVQVSLSGVPPEWVEGLPPPVRLLPGEQKAAWVTLHPPRAPESRAGAYSLVFHISPQSAPAAARAVEAELLVAPYTQFSSVLTPEQVRSGQTGRLTLQNDGNTPENFSLHWRSWGDELQFGTPPSPILVLEGQTVIVEFRANPRQAPLFGGGQAYPFSVEVSPLHGSSQTHSGEVYSQARIPAWFLPVLLVACLVLTGLAGLLPIGPGGRSLASLLLPTGPATSSLPASLPDTPVAPPTQPEAGGGPFPATAPPSSVPPTPFTLPTVTSAPTPTDFSRFAGQWMTNFAVLDLAQEGDQVTGTYTWYGAQGSIPIVGTQQGNTLNGSYAGDPSNQFSFTLSEDGQSFSGAWETSFQWCGVRSGPLLPGCGFSGQWQLLVGDGATPATAELTQTGNQVEGSFSLQDQTGTVTGVLGRAKVPLYNYTASGQYTFNNQVGNFLWTLVGFNSQQFQGAILDKDGQEPWCGWRDESSPPDPCAVPPQPRE